MHLHRLHVVEEHLFHLVDLRIFVLESQIDQLLSLNQGFDRGLDVWRLLVNFLNASESIHDGDYVLITLDGSLKDLEQKVNLVLIVIDVAHRVERSHNVLQVLVQFLSS